MSRPAAGNPPQCYPPPQKPPRGGLISYAILTCWPHATFIYTTLQDTSITPHPSQRVGFGSTLHRASYIQRTCRTMTMTWGVGFGGGVLAWAIYIYNYYIRFDASVAGNNPLPAPSESFTLMLLSRVKKPGCLIISPGFWDVALD